jgi:pimeloyl-ACP methyl ester carboxylesterase
VTADGARWRSDALGPARTLDLGAGRLVRAHVVPEVAGSAGDGGFRVTGTGPPVVLVHGALVNANLWRKVVPLLDGRTRVTLDLPLGSHLEAMPAGADLSPPALAELIADAIAALELEDATIVGNDTGGGLTQILAAHRPERIGRVVLTSCDAFDNFPPRLFRWVLAPARVPGAIPIAFGALRLPIAYGWHSNEAPEPEADDSYVLPVLTDRGVRRDVRKLLAGLDPRHTLDAAAKLTAFDKPVLIAWSADDRFFPPAHAERLARLIPDARLEWIEAARTFSPEDAPERLAELIATF